MANDTEKCAQCGETAMNVSTWGVYEIAGKKRDYPMNSLCLCDKCGQELFDRIKDSVTANHMYYQILPVEE